MQMLVWRYSSGDGHSCKPAPSGAEGSGRAQLDQQRHKSRPRLADRCRALYKAGPPPAFTKPLQFFTNLYATFLVHPGLLRPERANKALNRHTNGRF
jgi:hypothetical protein